MVSISEGGEPQRVPLVYYNDKGEREIIGEAAVQIQNGEVIALGKLNKSDAIGISIGGISIEAPSVGFGPTPIEEASARLGILRKGRSEHVTQRNPSGEVQVCDRTNVHAGHEWFAHPADFFTVYCPGKSSK